MEDYISPQLLQIAEEIGKDGWNANKTQAHFPPAGWAAPGGGQKVMQFRGKGFGLAIEIGTGNKKLKVFRAGNLPGLPGSAVQFGQLGPHRRQSLPGFGHCRPIGAAGGHEVLDLGLEQVSASGKGKLKGNDGPPFGLQQFHQGMGVGTVALGDHHHRLDVRGELQGGVDAFDPGTDGAGPPLVFGGAHSLVGIRSRR